MKDIIICLVLKKVDSFFTYYLILKRHFIIYYFNPKKN